MRLINYIKSNWMKLLKKLIFFVLTIFLFLFLFSIHFLVGLISLFCFFYLRLLIRFSLPEGGCYLWLGVPGSGKTTIAAWISKHYLDRNVRVFSNVPIKGTLKYNWKYHFGKYNMSNSIVICDEAGICLNGRNWKNNFDDKSLESIKKFRHQEMTLHFFSQANDEDPIVRNLSMTTYVVKKSLLKWFVQFRAIGMDIDILEQTRKHDFIEFWKPFSKKYVFCPPVWKLFDTLEFDPLPDREWETW